MVKREGTSRVRLTRRSYLKGVGVLAASGTGAVAGCTGSTSNGPAGDGQGDSGGSGQDGSGFEPADYFDISSMGVYDGLGDPIELYRVDAEPLGGKMHPAPRHLGDNPFEPEHGRWYDSAEADDSTLNDPQKIKMVELWHNTQWEPDPGDFPDGLSTWMWRASNEDGVEGWYVSTYVLAAGVHESGNIPVAFDSLGSLGITAYAETSDGTVEKKEWRNEFGSVAEWEGEPFFSYDDEHHPAVSVGALSVPELAEYFPGDAERYVVRMHGPRGGNPVLVE